MVKNDWSQLNVSASLPRHTRKRQGLTVSLEASVYILCTTYAHGFRNRWSCLNSYLPGRTQHLCEGRGVCRKVAWISNVTYRYCDFYFSGYSFEILGTQKIIWVIKLIKPTLFETNKSNYDLVFFITIRNIQGNLKSWESHLARHKY